MSSEEQQNWKKKLEDLEAQIYNSSSAANQNLVPQIRQWFGNLATPGKVVVVVVGVVFALSLLNTVFWVVKFSFSLAVLGIVVYFAYKFLFANKNQG